MKRKTFMQTSAAVLGGSLLPIELLGGTSKKRSIRFAHMTDFHLKPGLIPERETARALQHVQKLRPAMEFIINGGDVIMDALEVDKQKAQVQWDLLKSTLAKENNLPLYHTIGNHDIWGWFIKGNKPENDPHYGKAWAVEMLGMKDRYYSFTKENWKFIVLDSTSLNPAGGYIGKLDTLQREWLELELAATPSSRFVCIVSHIPILSICSGLFFNKTEINGDLLIKRNLMHTDFLDIKKLFLKYPNIRACISGHIHLQDELEYLGIKYYCNGAVSGNWWNGSFQEFAPAYAMMELYADGTSKRTMIKYNDNG